MSNRLAQLTAMFESEPTDPFLSYGIALEHAKAEDFDSAITWLDKTLAIDKHYCYAYFQKAKALSELGEDDDAQAILQTGMQIATEAGDEHARSEMAELLTSIQD